MNIKRPLPVTSWDADLYDPSLYGYIKVNVYTDNAHAVGEEVFCIVRQKDLLRYDMDDCYDYSLGILCNDCGVHSGITELIGLNAGQIIPIQFNGEFNPSIPIEWIQGKYWNL